MFVNPQKAHSTAKLANFAYGMLISVNRQV